LTLNISVCFTFSVEQNNSTGSALAEAAMRAQLAARACRKWELGGEADAVTETAAMAHHAALVATEAVVSDEKWGDPLDDPQTRRGRLTQAAWMLILAGTDEHGDSDDLFVASALFERASKS
jgi:hypothetical protein